jgi:cytochrome c
MKKLRFHTPVLNSLRVTGVLLVGLFCFSQPAQAQTDQLKKLMLANNCMACHMIDKTKYGPQFNEIGSKYIGNKAAVETLAAKIKAGGTGVWGDDYMPPQAQVSDADAKTIAELILALKPKE